MYYRESRNATRLLTTLARVKEKVNTQSKQRRGGVTDLYAVDYVGEIRNDGSGGISSSGGNSSGGVSVEEGDLSTEEARVRALTRAIKANEPNATATGIAGMAGNFGVESIVTAKRYETDHIVTDKYDALSKDPTVESLVGNWGAFQAMYGGISLNEGGYLAEDGKHYLGIGLGQWTGPRGKALLEFANQNNLDIWSFSAQIRFMFTESKASTAREVVTSNADVSFTTNKFLSEWEGVPGNALDRRIALAQKYLPWIQDELNNPTKPEQQPTRPKEESSTDKTDENAPNNSQDEPKDPKGKHAPQTNLTGENKPSDGQTAQPTGGNSKDISELWKSTYNTVDGGDANLKPHARRARHFLSELFGIKEAGGYRADGDGWGTGHGDGLAIDFMVDAYGGKGDPQGKGKALADFAAANFDKLQISYIIWEQKFYSGLPNIYGNAHTWNLMNDRGSNTQNHFDHVHISFSTSGGDQPLDLVFDGNVGEFTNNEAGSSSVVTSGSGEAVYRLLVPADLDRFQRWFLKVIVSNYDQQDTKNVNGSKIPMTDVHMTITATNSHTGSTVNLDVTNIFRQKWACDWIGSKMSTEEVYPNNDPMEGYDLMDLAWYLNNEERDALYSAGEKVLTIRAIGNARVTVRNFLKYSHIN